MTSNCNLADGLTQIPQKWYKSMKKGDELAQSVHSTSMEEPDEDTPSQRAPWCTKDMLFRVADQSINVHKCHERRSQEMSDVPVNRSRIGQMAKMKTRSR